jgi:hypothetical protein
VEASLAEKDQRRVAACAARVVGRAGACSWLIRHAPSLKRVAGLVARVPQRRRSRSTTAQGRQDLNLQPPVLETGALPIELRPSVAPRIVSAPRGNHSLVTSPENDNPETSRQAEDDLLQEQEGTGYGEDEGEREQALEAEDEQ